MKKAFIRILYGDPLNPNHNYLNDRQILESNIKYTINDKNEVPFIVYCFGEYNYNYLNTIGCKNVILADKNPWIDGEVSFSFLNKIYGWMYALMDFDEIVYLDWDTRNVKSIPSNFWYELNKKEEIQSVLVDHIKGILPWRRYRPDRANKKVPNGSFVYLRNKQIPELMLKFKADLDFNRDIHIGKRDMGTSKVTVQHNDEVYIARYMDNICGGWDGYEKYFKLFEPEWCEVKWGHFAKPNACFRHPLNK